MLLTTFPPFIQPRCLFKAIAVWLSELKNISQHPIKLLLSICVLLLPTLCHADSFYVSPEGNDSYPGTKDRPFATPERAVESVRQELAKKKDRLEPINVIFRGGVYRLSRPLKFTPDDSGTLDAPVTYTAAPGELVVFSGGIPITGSWTQTPGKPYWQITVPKAKDGGWIFNSLTVNGLSRMRARFPREGEKELRAEGPEPGGDSRHSLRCLPGDFNPAWTNPTDIDVVLLASWTPVIHRIREIIPEKRSLRFSGTDTHTVDAFDKNPRYYLSNVFEALTEPGEWYLNRRTGILYYYPMGGEDLSKAEVVAPLIKSRMIEFEGNLAADRPVEHLHFRDLHFRDVDSDLDRYDGMYRQGHMYLDAAVFAEGLRHASFERCEFSELGEYAMELADGCRAVTVRQCHFWDLGAGAMQLGVVDLATLKTPTTPGAKPGSLMEPRREVLDLTVDNNLIHRLGTVWHGCYGIGNRFASGTKITHNEIFDTHWDAVGLDARWDWKGEKYSHGNEVAYNHLHDLGLRYQTDAGGVYQIGPLDTHIHHNLIHDTHAYPYTAGYTGIYIDETSRGAVVENNIVYNLDWTAFIQNYGDDNVFRNNIGAFAREGFFDRGSLSHAKVNYMEVTRNIYIARDDKAQLTNWKPGEKPPIFNYNIYYSLTPGAKLTFAGMSFAGWKETGRDSNSVIMNPGCRDPDKFDFSIPADSPACKAVGFVPFDAEIKKAGLYGDTSWTNSIKLPPPRKFLPAWTDEELSPLNEIDIDPNQYNDGIRPPVLTAAARGVYEVTSKVAGMQGPKCIELEASQRYIHTVFHGLKQGKITFSYAVMQPVDQPAAITMEIRDEKGASYHAGPSVFISRDGQITAGKQKLESLQPGKWTHFEVSFALGDGAPQTYTLKIRNSLGEKSHVLPFVKDGIHEIQWLGFIFPDKEPGKCYLDDLHLKINKP